MPDSHHALGRVRARPGRLRVRPRHCADGWPGHQLPVCRHVLRLAPSEPKEPDARAAIGTVLFFFAIVFLATWAAGLWLYPFGPETLGGHALPAVLVGIVVALILAATLPNDAPRRGRTTMAGMAPPRNPPPVDPMNPASTAATLTPAQVTAAAQEEGALAAGVSGLGLFFWLLLVVLGFAIFIGYVA